MTTSADRIACKKCGNPFEPRKGMYTLDNGDGPYHGACLPAPASSPEGRVEEIARIIREKADVADNRWIKNTPEIAEAILAALRPSLAGDARALSNHTEYTPVSIRAAQTKSPPPSSEQVDRARINADYFNLILKECGCENSERAAVQLCEFIEGKRDL
jgi:hypothetical protein